MPGDDVMAAPSPVAGPVVGPVVGVIGKLPAHGDFVRRGGPATVLTRIDAWLDGELGGAIAAGMTLDAAVAALDGCRFAFLADGASVVAVVMASGDRVGRVFPLVASVTGAAMGLAAAETWCAAAADALIAIRDAGQGADIALAAVAAIDPPAGDDAMPAAGWWHPGDAVPVGTGLPVGEAFRALLSRGEA
jgi:type VI secretion system protein ImpM